MYAAPALQANQRGSPGVSRHTGRVPTSLPEPDLPLRDRLARLESDVPVEALRLWGAGLAAGDVSDCSLGHPPIEWLGGTRGWRPYWAQVWGLRLLLHIGVDARSDAAVAAALGDEAWRVREMALKVIARHDLDVDEAALVELLGDPVPRVRAQAAGALGLRAP